MVFFLNKRIQTLIVRHHGYSLGSSSSSSSGYLQIYIQCLFGLEACWLNWTVTLSVVPVRSHEWEWKRMDGLYIQIQQEGALSALR